MERAEEVTGGSRWTARAARGAVTAARRARGVARRSARATDMTPGVERGVES